MAKPSMTVEQLRRSARTQLKAAGIESSDIDCKILMRVAFGLDASGLIANAQNPLENDDIKRFDAMLARRLNHEPIAYIIGKQAFWSLEFDVSPDVLIPRPETEGVVERALELITNVDHPIIVDVGTGSGAILVSLLDECNDATGIGLDISDQALKVAQHNAEKNGVADRSAFQKSNYLSAFEATADLIVSNPPYITDQAMEELPKTVAGYEPALALRGGGDGLEAYKAIIVDLARILRPGGSIVFEIGYDQGQAVSQLLTINGFKDVCVEQDLAGHDRVVSGKLSA